MHHPDNFRSAVFRSLKKSILSGCQDPSDHIESGAVRRYARPPHPQQQLSTAMVSVGCGHRAAHRRLSGAEDGPLGSIHSGEAQLSRVSREAEKLQMVVDLWARQQLPGVHPRSVDVAEGLLRGALELQESLAKLSELQEASRSRKRRSRRDPIKPAVGGTTTTATTTTASAPAVQPASGTFDARNYQRIYDNPWHSFSSGKRREDFRRFAADRGLRRQCLPAAVSSSEENTTSFTQSLRFTSSSGSIASCSNFKSKSDSSDDSSVSCPKRNIATKAPSLIVKLMGLEDAPEKAIQPVDKQVVSSNYLDDAKMMPKASWGFRYAGFNLDPDGKTFQEMIDTLKIKARPKRVGKVVPRAAMDGSILSYEERPPIVVIKPMLRSFDDEVMRKDIHVDNASSKKQEDEEATAAVVDKEVVLDQNKKTLVRMLEGKDKKNDKAGKMEQPPNKNKLPPRTKVLPTATVNIDQKANTKPRKQKKNHEMPAQMPAVTTPSRRKVEEIKNIKKTVLPPAEVRRARSVPTKLQKQQPCPEESQAVVHKACTSTQNRDAPADPVMLVKEKRRARSTSLRELKPQREIKIASPQNSTELENENPIHCENANPSQNTSSPASCLPEIEKHESRILREDVRENDSNFIDESVTTPIHTVELPFLSQEESNSVDDPNSLAKPECLPCYEAEFPSTSQEDSRIVNDIITVVVEADADGEIKSRLLGIPSCVNNADESFHPDEAQSADLRITPQDTEIRNSKLLLDCCIELSQCRNYHMKLSNLAMLRNYAQNTYSLLSKYQLEEETREAVKKFRSYNEPAVDTASLGGLYWRLQVDLNCNGLMGIGGWDCGWIDGISAEQVEQIVSDIEECVACKLIEELTLELVSSPV